MAVVEKMKELAKMTLPTRESAPSTTSTPSTSTPTPGAGLTAEQLIAELARQKRSAA
jgi:hypothetical protein